MSKLKEISDKVTKGAIHNDLVASPKRGKLGQSSIRLLAFMIAQISKEDSELTKYKIDRHDLKEHVLKCPDNLLSREINTMCAELSTHSVYIDWGEGRKEYSAIAPTIIYNDRDYWIEFTFNERLKPHLLSLTNHFTKYQLETVFSLKGTYAFYAYMYFKKFLHDKTDIYKAKVTLKEFKGIISASSKYELYGRFKERVLLPLQNEFKERADITFTFKEIKKGRKVDALEFTIRRKKNYQPKLDIDEPEPVELTAEQKETIRQKEKAKEYWQGLSIDEQDTLKAELQKENTLFSLDTERGIIQALLMSREF